MPEYTDEELASMQQGIVEGVASPERQIADGAKQVTMRSVAELREAHAFIAQQRNAAAPQRPRSRRILGIDREYH